MLEAKRIETNQEPKKIEFLGDGSYYYNYDIKAKVVTVSPMNDEDEEHEETVWSFVQVHLYGKPNYSQCVRAVIRQYVDQDEEFDLINSAQRATYGLRTNSSSTQDYLDYLTLVDTIKSNVKADLG